MSSLEDRMISRSLTFDELWNSWPIKGINGKWQVVDNPLPPEARNESIFTSSFTPTIFPKIRTDISLSSTNELVARLRVRYLKLKIISFILDQDVPKDDSEEKANDFSDICMDILDQCPQDDLGRKLKGCQFLIRIGVQKIKEGKTREAFRAFAVAWTELLPYHIDAIEVGQLERIQMANLENTIFFNIQIICNALSNSPIPSTRSTYSQLGYSAGLIALTLYYGITAGGLARIIEILRELTEKIKSFPNISTSNYLSGPMVPNIQLLQDYAINRPPNFNLSHLDPKIQLDKIRSSEKERLNNIEPNWHYVLPEEYAQAAEEPDE